MPPRTRFTFLTVPGGRSRAAALYWRRGGRIKQAQSLQFIPQRLNLGVAMVATMAMTREYTDRERLSVR